MDKKSEIFSELVTIKETLYPCHLSSDLVQSYNSSELICDRKLDQLVQISPNRKSKCVDNEKIDRRTGWG